MRPYPCSKYFSNLFRSFAPAGLFSVKFLLLCSHSYSRYVFQAVSTDHAEALFRPATFASRYMIACKYPNLVGDVLAGKLLVRQIMSSSYVSKQNADD